MMLQMILFKRDAVRYDERQIGEEAEGARRPRARMAKGQIVRDLVNAERQRVRNRAGKAIAGYQEPCPVRVAKHVEAHQLNEHHGNDLPFERRVVPEEAPHFRMLFQYELSSGRVRLVVIFPLEVLSRVIGAHFDC